GDNELIVTGGGTNTKLFYLRGIVIKPAEKHWVVRPTLSAFDGDAINATVYAENNYTEEPMQMVLAVALYNESGELLSLSELPIVAENGTPVSETLTASAPDTAVSAKAFVWEGTSVYESSMMY
ncbi:MAG: hypothetical protein IJ367_02105, partial [Clostridia bacterium]|nr:hypothetical protein [Clostridia bacterium]